MLKILKVPVEDGLYEYVVYSLDTNSEIARFPTYEQAKAFLG